MTATGPLTPAEHVTAATVFLARSGDYSDTPAGIASEAAAIGRAQVHATLATIPGPDPGAGVNAAKPTTAPAKRPPNPLEVPSIGEDPVTVEHHADGHVVIGEGNFPAMVDDPDAMDRVAEALRYYAHQARAAQAQTPREAPTP